MRVFFIFLFFSISLSSISQITSIIGDVGVDEFAHAVTVDDSGYVYLGGGRNQNSMIIKFDSNLNTIWSKEITVSGQSVYNSEVGVLEIIGDTIFGCGWVSSGPYDYKGAYYFKMNKNTGVFYWIKTFNSLGYNFSNMRYYNNRFYISGGVFSSSTQHEIKVFCVNSLDGSLVWETGNVNVAFTSGADFLDDIAPMSEIVNGKFYIPGRSYVNGASGGLNMRPTLFGFDINGNMILNKYLLYPESQSVHRFYGLDIHFDGADSLVYTFWGDDNCSSCTNFKGGVAKMDLLGNVSFSKMLDVNGSPSEYMRKSNIGNNSYVFFLEKNYTQSNSSIVLIKTDTGGNTILAKEISLPGSSLKVNFGSSGYAKSSIFINGYHYFTAQRIVNTTGEKDIVLVCVDENLNTLSSCFILTTISINEIDVIPFSNDINILNSPHNINIESPYTVSPYSYTNQCDTTGISVQENIYGCDSVEIIVSSSASNPYSVLWPDGSTSNSHVFYGDSVVMVNYLSQSSCCTVTDTIVITLNSIYPIVDLGVDTSVCLIPGDSILLSAIVSNCFNCIYNWSNGDTTSSISVTSSGIYSVDVMNQCLLHDYDSVLFTINEFPLLIPISDTSVCQGALPFNATSSFSNYDSIIWSNGDIGTSTTINNYGIYTVFAYNACGVVLDSFLVDSISMVQIDDISNIDTCLSENASLIINILTSNASNVFVNTVQSNFISANSDSTFIISALNQCSYDTMVFSVEINRNLVFDAPDSILICDNEVEISSLNVNSNYPYLIYGANGNLVNGNLSETDNYSIVVNSPCKDTSHIMNISFDSALSFYAPNTFTPDGDEINNIYEFVGANYLINEISIYNQWGERIYYESGHFSGWNGTYREKKCKDGTYVVIVSYEGCEGKSITKKLHVNLIR